MTSAPPPKRTKYAYSWALSVVDNLLKKHARATMYFCEFLGMPPTELAKILASRPTEWQFCRDTITAMAHQLDLHPETIISARDYSIFVKVKIANSHGNLPERFVEYLKERISAL